MTPYLATAPVSRRGGYTLVELMIAVGLFAVVMLLSSGAYLVMISLNRQAQSMSNGIDNLAFALETMTRNIRTGVSYSCGAFGGDCTTGASTFSLTNQKGQAVSYSLSGTALQQIVAGTQSLLTDSSVTITSLTFYAFGTDPTDYEQSRVTVSISGTVSPGPGKPAQAFTIETGATMRGTDLGSSSATPPPTGTGQQAYTSPGTYAWVAPASVTSVSVVCVGGGGGGYDGSGVSNGPQSGGGGGGLGYKNNISVIPGNSYTVYVGAGGSQISRVGQAGESSYFIDSSTVRGGGGGGGTSSSAGSGGNRTGNGGGSGGSGAHSGSTNYWHGGGGAGGYSGNGGKGGATIAGINPTAGSGGGGGGGNVYQGGGVGINGQGTSGAAGDTTTYVGKGGSGGGDGDNDSSTGGRYGGGGAGNSGVGASGACRIIWPGDTRQFPSTGTGDQ